MLYIRMIQSLTHGAWPPTVIIFIPSYISHMLLVKGISLFSSIHTDNVTLPYLCIHSGMATRCTVSLINNLTVDVLLNCNSFFMTNLYGLMYFLH